MTDHPVYLLDTNFYIQAWHFYPIEIFPGVWKWLKKEHETGRLLLIDKVSDELKGIGLKEWKKQNLKAVKSPPERIENFAQVMDVAGKVDVAGKKYKKEALEEFALAADSFLIADALAYGAVLVTDETLDNQSIKRVKIPNVCRHLNVRMLQPVQLIRELGPCFIWKEEQSPEDPPN